MNPFIITVVLFSTFMHAGWNLLARNQRSEIAFFSRVLTIIVFFGFIPAVLSETLTHSLSAKAWLCVIGSGSFCGMYYFFLAHAYGTSDFTTVYPVVRALPVILVAIGDVLRGRYPSYIGWIGILLVAFGCFLAPLYSLRSFEVRLYLNRRTLWMILAAFGTVGYTLLDKVASESVMEGPATAARYGYIFFLISAGAFNALMRIFKVEGQALKLVGWRYPFVAACLTFGAYWLVLWAYQLAQHASYIIAFRQFSIVIGVILAFTMYKESGRVIRLTAVSLIAVGLICIGFWGR